MLSVTLTRDTVSTLTPAPAVPALERSPKDMVTATQAVRSRPWIAPVTFSAVSLGYLAIVFTNTPPFVRSDHLSLNWNMMFIAGLGAVSSMIVLAAIFSAPVSNHIGKVSASIIGVEAGIILILSSVLLYRSLSFFGIV